MTSAQLKSEISINQMSPPGGLILGVSPLVLHHAPAAVLKQDSHVCELIAKGYLLV
jgi:hypothetical protein